MKFSKAIVSTMIIGTCLTACGNQQKKQSEMDKTPEAYSMLNVLEKLPQHKMFMFGHHDDPVYGIGWDGDENLGMNIREVGSGGERICAQLKIIKRFGE